MERSTLVEHHSPIPCLGIPAYESTMSETWCEVWKKKNPGRSTLLVPWLVARLHWWRRHWCNIGAGVTYTLGFLRWRRPPRHFSLCGFLFQRPSRGVLHRRQIETSSLLYNSLWDSKLFVCFIVIYFFLWLWWWKRREVSTHGCRFGWWILCKYWFLFFLDTLFSDLMFSKSYVFFVSILFI